VYCAYDDSCIAQLVAHIVHAFYQILIWNVLIQVLQQILSCGRSAVCPLEVPLAMNIDSWLNIGSVYNIIRFMQTTCYSISKGMMYGLVVQGRTCKMLYCMQISFCWFYSLSTYFMAHIATMTICGNIHYMYNYPLTV